MSYVFHWKPGSLTNGAGGSSPTVLAASGSSPRGAAGSRAFSPRELEARRLRVCWAQRLRGTRPPRNIDSIRAVRRFMPGGLLAELAGERSSQSQSNLFVVRDDQ